MSLVERGRIVRDLDEERLRTALVALLRPTGARSGPRPASRRWARRCAASGRAACARGAIGATRRRRPRPPRRPGAACRRRARAGRRPAPGIGRMSPTSPAAVAGRPEGEARPRLPAPQLAAQAGAPSASRPCCTRPVAVPERRAPGRAQVPIEVLDPPPGAARPRPAGPVDRHPVPGARSTSPSRSPTARSSRRSTCRTWRRPPAGQPVAGAGRVIALDPRVQVVDFTPASRSTSARPGRDAPHAGHGRPRHGARRAHARAAPGRPRHRWCSAAPARGSPRCRRRGARGRSMPAASTSTRRSTSRRSTRRATRCPAWRCCPSVPASRIEVARELAYAHAAGGPRAHRRARRPATG